MMKQKVRGLEKVKMERIGTTQEIILVLLANAGRIII